MLVDCLNRCDSGPNSQGLVETHLCDQKGDLLPLGGVVLELEGGRPTIAGHLSHFQGPETTTPRDQ